MSNLSSTAGVVAIAGCAIGAVAVIVSLVLAAQLRRIRRDQRVVIGDGEQDLVAHAASLQQQFRALHEYVQDAAKQLGDRVDVTEHRLDRTVSHSALVRYDAYGEMSGRQSTSIALLDARRSGLILSSIHHRDQARLYAKEMYEGHPSLELSPEESEAVRLCYEERGGAAPAS